MKRRVAIATLGCKVNQYESAAFGSGFAAAGCRVVDPREAADIYVINTCAVTARAGQQSRQLIRRILRENPKARCVVTGCYVQAEGAKAATITDGPLIVIGNGEKDQLVRRVLLTSDGEEIVEVGDISRQREICHLEVGKFRGRTRAFLRIQDGCNNFCSYCIVPHTRGPSRSLPLADVRQQVDIFRRNHYREIVVTGINVGKYGLDLDEGETIISLLDLLCSRYPDIRFRLSSIEPPEINDALLELAVRHANFMPHFHIPLQSGDDAVLKRMRRRYTVDLFVEAVWKLHRLLPGAAIGVDVLAGFPGEDGRAHARTVQLLEELPVTYLHVFPYSRRPGTPAAAMAAQVSREIKGERVARLRTVDREKRGRFHRRALHRTLRVLVEGRDEKTGMYRGFSENYVPVFFQGGDGLVNHVVEVVAERVMEKGVRARLLEK